MAPNTNFRPLLYAYHNCLSKEWLDPYPPAQRIPVTGDLFAEDPQTDTDNESEK